MRTDQLSQAVLLEFAESGRLGAHRARVLKAGTERLAATLAGCREFLPAGTRWTRPEGGMNVWVRLPEPLDAGELLPRAQRAGVAYLPARYFAVSRWESSVRSAPAERTPQTPLPAPPGQGQTPEGDCRLRRRPNLRPRRPGETP